MTAPTIVALVYVATGLVLAAVVVLSALHLGRRDDATHQRLEGDQQ